MKPPDEKERSSTDSQPSLAYSFFQPILQGTGKTIGILIFPVVGIILLLYLLQIDNPIAQTIVSVGNEIKAQGIGLGLGAATATVLATALEAPLMVAVGVGIVVWWLVTTLM